MSILNVNQIQPVGSGQTITISASDITASSATITASKITASSGDFTVGTGSSVYSPATNTLALGTNSAERVRITSDGKVSIGGFNPAVAGLSISNSSTNRGLEFDTGSGFDSTSCIRAYDRPTTAYKSLGLTGSDIKFGINDVKKVSITSAGNVEISNGNLVFSTSGTGIDFSATSDGSGTSSSEILDDYEEGSWTPTLTDSSQANVYSSGTRYGYYTKVGRIVTATAVFDNATCVAGNNVKVGGLPYTITSTTTRYPGFNSHTTGAAISGTTIQGGYARPGETNFQLIQQNSFSTVNFSSGAFYMFLTFVYAV